MWDFIVSYTLPIFMILFLAVTWFRMARKNKTDGKSNKSFFKYLALTVVVAVVVISALSYMIINMTV
ncbi:hypothetical protein NHM07_20805 [Bacillus subtilis]|uniref:hypothetical protein n=1 Tax=Bacillus subtilis TaxID=1423 RepID=UPI00209A860B|nr:hypothetical protein [Bacillus subtilis]MCO8150937.1 hypothetical protein [Bacillus subtilis]